MRRGAAAELPLGHRHQPDCRMACAEAQREQGVAEVVPVDDHARPASLRRVQRHRQRRQHRRRLRENHRRVGIVEGGGERPSLRGGAAGGAGEIARPGRRARRRRIRQAAQTDTRVVAHRCARLAAGEADQIDAGARAGEPGRDTIRGLRPGAETRRRRRAVSVMAALCLEMQ
jgi:hypothetical protein